MASQVAEPFVHQVVSVAGGTCVMTLATSRSIFSEDARHCDDEELLTLTTVLLLHHRSAGKTIPHEHRYPKSSLNKPCCCKSL